MYNGGAISWRSSQQSIPALSTSEAEYMSLSDAAKEARSLLKLNLTLKTNNKNNIVIYEDNRGCEKWTRTLSEPNRTKHIDIHYHHIREMVKLGKISIEPVATSLQLADAVTKALPRPQHEFLMEKYCGWPVSASALLISALLTKRCDSDSSAAEGWPVSASALLISALLTKRCSS